MAYCTSAQVQAEFKGIVFDASSNPTDSDVSRLIDESDSMIDAVIGVRYVTPVTAGAGLTLLQNLAIRLTAERIRNILAVKTGNKEIDQGNKSASDTKAVMDCLAKIAKREIVLQGAIDADPTEGVSSMNVSNGQTYTFQRGTDQW